MNFGVTGEAAPNDGPALFSSAVRSVAEGGIFLRPETASEIAFLRASAKSTKISNLRPRELGILRLIAAGRTMAEIAEEEQIARVRIVLEVRGPYNCMRVC